MELELQLFTTSVSNCVKSHELVSLWSSSGGENRMLLYCFVPVKISGHCLAGLLSASYDGKQAAYVIKKITPNLTNLLF